MCSQLGKAVVFPVGGCAMSGGASGIDASHVDAPVVQESEGVAETRCDLFLKKRLLKETIEKDVPTTTHTWPAKNGKSKTTGGSPLTIFFEERKVNMLMESKEAAMSVYRLRRVSVASGEGLGGSLGSPRTPEVVPQVPAACTEEVSDRFGQGWMTWCVEENEVRVVSSGTGR